MKNRLLISITKRISEEIAPQSPLKYMKPIAVNDYIDELIAIAYLYTRPKKGNNKSIFFVEIISAIGHGVRGKFKMKRDSSVAAKTGAFLLYSFEQLGMIEVILGQGGKGHATYILKVTDDEAIRELWAAVTLDKSSKLPSRTKYAPWSSSKHATGAMLVKTGNKGVLEKVTLENCPMVFDAINKSQETGWNINKDIFKITQWALSNKTEAFSDIWDQQNPEAKATKTREATAIIDIAKKFLNETFYHLYYYDFRGRKYPTTAYLHEQGTDLAKGLLLRKDKKAIGWEGFQWLMLSIASNWAGGADRGDGAKTDKIPLHDRFEWAMANEDTFLLYASHPKTEQGWMKADKPWQFLAACIELMKMREWQYMVPKDFHNYEYESGLECFIDGTNNGSQHLSALVKDEVTAPHVNLVPIDMPGDLYKYVADFVWEDLDKKFNEFSKEEIDTCEIFIDDLIRLKREIHITDLKSERRKDLTDRIHKFRASNEEVIKKSAIVYWHRITDNKQRRKIVKRNVMTLPLVVKTRWK